MSGFVPYPYEVLMASSCAKWLHVALRTVALVSLKDLVSRESNTVHTGLFAEGTMSLMFTILQVQKHLPVSVYLSVAEFPN